MSEKKPLKKNNVSIRMTDELVHEINMMGLEQNRNFSNMMETLIKIGIRHMKNNQTKTR